jgi:hypothetical protein
MTSPLWANQLYSLKDLAALEKEKNFEEFLAHVNDIRPSERMKLWRDMYQSMAMEMIDYKLKTKDFSLATFKKIENLSRSNTLLNDEFFQLKRSLYAKKFFSECYSGQTKNGDISVNTKQCDDELSTFWYFSKKDPDIGLEMAKIVEKNNGKMNTWNFYQKAVSDTLAPLYCEKPEVQRALIQKVTQEVFDPEFNGEYGTLLKRIIPDKCFVKLVNPLRLVLESTQSSGLDKEISFQLLDASKNLKPIDYYYYATLYLIDEPVTGEKMNVSWKKIEELAEKYSLRMEILEKIKGANVLPDKVMRSPSNKRNKAIIHLFAKHFPEFLDYYAKSCLDYLQYKNSPNRPVTTGFQCHEFLKMAKSVKQNENIEWVSDSVQTRFSSLKK